MQSIRYGVDPAMDILAQSTFGRGKGSHILPSDECGIIVKMLIFPERMRNLLNSEDWEPIIASSLVYHRKLIATRFKHLMRRWIIGVVLPLSLLTTLLTAFFAPRLLISIPVVILVIAILVAVLANYLSAPYTKRMKLLADKIASEKVGRDNFLQVLRKIDSCGMEDLTKLSERRGMRARFTGKPTVGERIKNLTQQ